MCTDPEDFIQQLYLRRQRCLSYQNREQYALISEDLYFE